MNVGKVCTRTVATIRPSDSVLDAARAMRQHHVGNLVVVAERGGKSIPTGIITDRDLVVNVLATEAKRLEALSISEVVTPTVVTARESDEVADVLAKMTEHMVRRIPVVDDDGGLVGIFTLDDMLQLLSHDVASIAALVRMQRRREANWSV
jgi:CBS domain-containing protein